MIVGEERKEPEIHRKPQNEANLQTTMNYFEITS